MCHADGFREAPKFSHGGDDSDLATDNRPLKRLLTVDGSERQPIAAYSRCAVDCAMPCVPEGVKSMS